MKAQDPSISTMLLLGALAHGMRPQHDPREPLPEPPEPEPRSCGTCTLCCKTFRNFELNKPENTWCQYACSRKSSKPGCSIYATRPAECVGFSCIWLLDDGTIFPGENHRPDKVGIVIDPIPSDQLASFMHPIFRQPGIMFLRVTQQHGGVWRQLKARNTMRNVVEALRHRQVIFVIDESPQSKTIFDGKTELTMRPLEHELGRCWSMDDFMERAKAALDKFAADPKYMLERAEATVMLEAMSMAERGLAAALGQDGVTFVLEYQRAKIEEFAVFLRRIHPDRTFEVRVVELPKNMERFSTEGL